MVSEGKNTVFANFQLTNTLCPVLKMKWSPCTYPEDWAELLFNFFAFFFFLIGLKWEIVVLQKFSATWYLYSKIRWVWNTSWLNAVGSELWWNMTSLTKTFKLIQDLIYKGNGIIINCFIQESNISCFFPKGLYIAKYMLLWEGMLSWNGACEPSLCWLGRSVRLTPPLK